jgi:hypothetical protein
MQLTVTTEDDKIVSVDVDPGTVVENLKVRVRAPHSSLGPRHPYPARDPSIAFH